MDQQMIFEYLKFLECTEAAEISEENLFRLHRSHLEKIHYTNAMIYFESKTPSLDEESLFDRIVVKRLGGYCFELNGLFACLLRALGYQVTEYFARWHAGETDAVPMRRHRVLEVHCEGKKFLADVGVGCLISATPLEFVHDTVQQKNFRSYRIIKDPVLGNVVQAESQDGFYPLYSFTCDPHYPHDFEYVNFYCSQNQESRFRQKLFFHRQGDDFRIFIENPAPESPDWALCEIKNDVIRRTPINSAEQFRDILQQSFGVSYSLDMFKGKIL